MKQGVSKILAILCNKPKQNSNRTAYKESLTAYSNKLREAKKNMWRIECSFPDCFFNPVKLGKLKKKMANYSFAGNSRIAEFLITFPISAKKKSKYKRLLPCKIEFSKLPNPRKIKIFSHDSGFLKIYEFPGITH